MNKSPNFFPAVKRVSLFQNVRATRPEKEMTLADVAAAIRGEDLLQWYESNETSRDLKAVLPAVTFSGTFSKRSRTGLIEHSGLIGLDIDTQDNPILKTDLDAIRGRLKGDPVALAYRTPSGGLRVVVVVEGAEKDHLAAWHAAASWIFGYAGLVADPACKDICRLSFLAMDPGAWLNPELEEDQP
jgi:hypothetical protein